MHSCPRPFSIRHTIVLDDPFPDPAELETLIPPESPQLQLEEVRACTS